MQIKQTFKRVVSQAFVRHAATLITGNAVGQLIAFAAYLVLCRLYSPDDFGLFNLFLSIGGFLAFFSTCSFHYAIVLPANDKYGMACLRICLCINLIFSMLCTLVCGFGNNLIATQFGAPQLARYLPWMGLFVCTYGLWSTLNYWYIRTQKFRWIAGYQVGQATVTSAAKISCAAYPTATTPHGGLITGTLIGQTLSVIIAAFGLRNHWLQHVTTSRTTLLVCVRKYSNFLKFTFPKDLVNYLGGNLPILLLAAYFPIEMIGFYGMATALSMRPVNLLVNSFYQSLYQRCTELFNQQRSLKFLFRLFGKGAVIAIPAFVVLYFVLPPLVQILLGDGWQESARLLQLMLPWLACTLLCNPFDFLADIFSKQARLLVFEICETLLRATALAVGIAQHSFEWAIGLYGAASCLIILLRTAWYVRLILQYEKNIIYETTAD
ncbi:MAG: oligosaccharide flippase family protein [Paludibacteraceae bacterium]|nr:oligosaccharide flippase family protein [Paludibacteraceae bacterium]